MYGYLKGALDNIQNKAIPNNWDCVALVIGREGSGKTTLATQMANYLDKNFTVENIVFKPEEFNKLIDDCKPESAIIYDEAITGLQANQHASNISRTIVSKLTMIRKKKLKIFIVFPYLHLLQKYFVMRCLFCVYVYAKSFDERGYGNFYNSPKTEFLYNMMKMKYPMNPNQAYKEAKKSFYFKFGSKFCGDESEYQRRKDEATKEACEEDNKNIWKDRFADALSYIKDNKIMPISQLASAISLHKQQLYDLISSK